MAQLEHWERAGQVAEWHAAHPHAITAPGEWAPLTGGNSEAGKSAGLATSARELSALVRVGLGLVHVDLGCTAARHASWRRHAPWRRRPPGHRLCAIVRR